MLDAALELVRVTQKENAFTGNYFLSILFPRGNQHVDVFVCREYSFV